MKDASSHTTSGLSLKSVVLWILLLGLSVSAWTFGHWAKGQSVGEVLQRFPWWWVALGVVVLFALSLAQNGLDRLVGPEVQVALTLARAEIERKRATCQRCSRLNEPQTLSCARCGKVLDWSTIVMTALLVVVLIGVSWSSARL